MSKKTKAKAKKKRYNDVPDYVRPSKDEPSFPCPRCGANVGSPANLPDHQLDVHLPGTGT